MIKYTQYIELRGQETELKQKDVGLKKEQLKIDNQRLGLKQKEEEHSLRMDRERADLEDRSAKRRRFDRDTDKGITFNQRTDCCLEVHTACSTQQVSAASIIVLQRTTRVAL